MLGCVWALAESCIPAAAGECFDTGESWTQQMPVPVIAECSSRQAGGGLAAHDICGILSTRLPGMRSALRVASNGFHCLGYCGSCCLAAACAVQLVSRTKSFRCPYIDSCSSSCGLNTWGCLSTFGHTWCSPSSSIEAEQHCQLPHLSPSDGMTCTSLPHTLACPADSCAPGTAPGSGPGAEQGCNGQGARHAVRRDYHAGAIGDR